MPLRRGPPTDRSHGSRPVGFSAGSIVAVRNARLTRCRRAARAGRTGSPPAARGSRIPMWTVAPAEERRAPSPSGRMEPAHRTGWPPAGSPVVEQGSAAGRPSAEVTGGNHADYRSYEPGSLSRHQNRVGEWTSRFRLCRSWKRQPCGKLTLGDGSDQLRSRARSGIRAAKLCLEFPDSRLKGGSCLAL